MTFAMRRENRREVDRQAWLDIGGGIPLLACTLIDISPRGAKLAIDNAGQVPQTFRLHLTRGGPANFCCRIVWRSTDALGVSLESAAHDMDGADCQKE